MASLFSRRRGLIFKVIVGVPILWFSFIGLTVVMQGGGGGLPRDMPREIDAHEDPRVPPQVRQPREDHRLKDYGDSNNLNNGDHTKRTQPPPQHFMPPVIEAPNEDAKRLEDAMHDHFQNEFKGIEQERRQGRVKDDGDLKFNPKTEKEDPRQKHMRQTEVPLQEKHVVDPSAPGEMGKAVNINKEKLSPDERKKYDQGWQKNAFNQYASDMISLHRSLPDVRDAGCGDIKYPPPSELPDATVVVIFHNEAWSVLLRTVHSVLDRSPPELIKEIILVDDYSDLDHLKEPLEEYAASLGKVKVRRAKKREGLIRARLLGASVATGEVIIFLDSHCEATEGWLEPMLARIHENKTNVPTPVIDVIDDSTLRYQHSSAKSTSVGGFDWNLQFNWHAIPDHERRRRPSDIYPVRSPTMAGGLFAISREYFEYLGTYDPGMDIWGGENLELSFRIWMCGGSLEIIPCSHVGHIFRKRSPYSWKTGVNVVKKNSIRLAEVWMDDYKNYYYERFNYDLGNYGDVAARKELRQKLQCKTFDWYIKNIYPDLFIPGEAVASGEIRNKMHAQCLDSSVDKASYNKPIKMWPCHNMGGNQFWMMSKMGEIRRDEGCMDYAGQFVMIYPCHGMKGNQEWVYGPDNTVRHRNTNLCIELNSDGQKLEMKACTGIDRQIWLWKRKMPDQAGKKMLR